MTEKKLLDEGDVDNEFHLSKAWLRKHRLLGDGPPFIRINRMIFYKRDQLEKWIDQHAVAARQK